ncbi:TetR/AcrR family transcriptional regulator C-terminal domain-containing protein [Streptomyces nigra]
MFADYDQHFEEGLALVIAGIEARGLLRRHDAPPLRGGIRATRGGAGTPFRPAGPLRGPATGSGSAGSLGRIGALRAPFLRE